MTNLPLGMSSWHGCMSGECKLGETYHLDVWKNGHFRYEEVCLQMKGAFEGVALLMQEPDSSRFQFPNTRNAAQWRTKKYRNDPTLSNTSCCQSNHLVFYILDQYKYKV